MVTAMRLCWQLVEECRNAYSMIALSIHRFLREHVLRLACNRLLRNELAYLNRHEARLWSDM